MHIYIYIYICKMLNIVGPNFGHIVNGPRSTKWAAKIWSLVRVFELQTKTSKIWRLRKDCWDRGAVASTARAACYKVRGTDSKNDTLKTLERATPTFRPCFHQPLDLFFARSDCNIRSYFTHCIQSHSSIKVHFCLAKTDYIVVF